MLPRSVESVFLYTRRGESIPDPVTNSRTTRRASAAFKWRVSVSNTSACAPAAATGFADTTASIPAARNLAPASKAPVISSARARMHMARWTMGQGYGGPAWVATNAHEYTRMKTILPIRVHSRKLGAGLQSADPIAHKGEVAHGSACAFDHHSLD